MIRNKRKIIFITMIFIAIIIFGLFNKVDANSTTDENGTIWHYDVNENGKAEIYKLSGEIPENITIPSNLDGYEVVKVRNRCFLLWFIWK